MGLGNLKDTIVRKLALRWLRGKTEDLRSKDKETGMGKVLKFLDGWKLVIVTLVIFGSRVYDAANNGHTGDLIGSVLAALGFLPAAGSTDMVAIGAAATGALAICGVFSRVYKAQAQIRAGSSVAGALTTEGYVAKAVADAQTSNVKGAELQKIMATAEAIAAIKAAGKG